MRLAWRGWFGGKRGARSVWILGIVFVGLFIVGVPMGLGLRRATVPIIPVIALIVDLVLALVFTLMLSQTLASAIEALYTRDDFDLLLSSPLEPRRILVVRFLALAANAFVAFAVFIGPVLLPIALVGHPAWLAAFVVLAAIALAASATGLWMAMALFRLIGPRRTRGVAQVLAALIGAAFFLVSQSANLMGRRTGGAWMWLFQYASAEGRAWPPAAGWVLQAMTGEALPLAGLVTVSAALFGVTAWTLGDRFVADAAAASGSAIPARAPRGRTKAFASGAFAATFRKESRLLWRDIAMLAQVLLRVLYMLPLAFVILRNANGMGTALVPLGTLSLCVLTGQVASSLAWITVSAEDAPGLLASAPAPMKVVRRAKLTAAMVPLAVLLVGPLIGLIVLAPAAGIAATVGCAASAWSSGLIVVWRQPPGKRSDFRNRRRAGGSLVASLGSFFVALLIGGATAMAATATIWASVAVIPAVLALVLMLLLRRTDAQLAETMQAAS